VRIVLDIVDPGDAPRIRKALLVAAGNARDLGSRAATPAKREKWYQREQALLSYAAQVLAQYHEEVPPKTC
jgi:hypothetical protein